MTGKRLIEVDFPLEQVSLDSVHEKNVRHGHISTLHIWPARRPLAASRAALIATLLPDPGDPEERKAIYQRLAGRVVERIEGKKVGGRTVEKRKRETEGGILHWGRENGPDLDWFRAKIKEAYGGRAPKVLDPFAGGGAIPLEAMRLGCEVTAIDINPVAWFILKCTLEYPQRLAGKTRPLPDFALGDRDFMEGFLKAKGHKGAGLARELARLGLAEDGAEPEQSELLSPLGRDAVPEADLAWQVRAWGRWVLAEARRQLARRYPTYAEFQALKPGGKTFKPRPLQLLEPHADGNVDAGPLNAGLGKTYLKDPRNPRWVAKPAVAYLWARTVRCKGCRATVPLLKTRWLAKKDKKRVLLTMTPNEDRTGVMFGIEHNAPLVGGNAAQRREHDKRRGAGTMSRSGAQCPCCPTIMTSEDIRLEGRDGRLGIVMTAVVVDGPDGKEYRLPTEHELQAAQVPREELDALFASIPHGLPIEPIPLGASRSGGGSPFTAPLFGIDQWAKLFTGRQLATQGTLIKAISAAHAEITTIYEHDIAGAIVGFLACIMDRQADYGSAGCMWINGLQIIGHQFSRFALPIVWDIAEVCPLTNSSGGLESAYEWVTKVVDHLEAATIAAPRPTVEAKSAIDGGADLYDAIITDPPYYDAIPYSDLMDFFYVWLRRLAHSVADGLEDVFSAPLGPKWNTERENGELIDDASRFGGDKVRSKQNYEDGMARAFQTCLKALNTDGRLIVVFASKSPAAWETLVAALIRAGFVVDGSWPIQTERQMRLRSVTSAALASSVWLVCKKRPLAKPGWDSAVLAEMRERIQIQMRTFWDSGIRGPDFVWAATGPALEAFSKYPVVKKADAAHAQMTVSEFLREVRRIVVDFVVGHVLPHDGDTEETTGLDDITTYYLLHRKDFRLDDAPIGAALSCNLSDSDLADRFDLLARSDRTLLDALDDEDDESEIGDENAEADDAGAGAAGKGSKVKLKAWNQRKAKWLGYEASGGRPVPLIDQAHRLMHLWRAGDQAKVDDYLEARGLKRHPLFAKLLQALIELAPAASEERSILESLSNHIAARGGISAPRQMGMAV